MKIGIENIRRSDFNLVNAKLGTKEEKFCFYPPVFALDIHFLISNDLEDVFIFLSSKDVIDNLTLAKEIGVNLSHFSEYLYVMADRHPKLHQRLYKILLESSYENLLK